MQASVAQILEALEGFYGLQEAPWPADPYEYLVWLHCGYPASDARCARGWASLKKNVGVTPERILAATDAELTEALTPGGMVPALRAQRLREVAARVVESCGGDLAGALAGSGAEKARKFLKKFPGIGDPGADRMLLFAGIEAVAAAPSNCPHVLVRIRRGLERENYGVTYQEAQEELGSVPANFAARQRAFLLLKRHGQEICKAAKPRCGKCPVEGVCAFRRGVRRGRG